MWHGPAFTPRKVSTEPHKRTRFAREPRTSRVLSLAQTRRRSADRAVRDSLDMYKRRPVVLKSVSRGPAWFFAAVFLGLSAIFVANGLGDNPKDLPWLALAVPLCLLCAAVANSQVTCDQNGIRYRLFKTVRIPVAEVTALRIDSKLSQSSGRTNLILVIERRAGKPIRCLGTAVRDKPQSRATLEASAQAMRGALGLPRFW